MRTANKTTGLVAHEKTRKNDVKQTYNNKTNNNSRDSSSSSSSYTASIPIVVTARKPKFIILPVNRSAVQTTTTGLNVH